MRATRAPSSSSFVVLAVWLLAGCASELTPPPAPGPRVLLHQTRTAGGAWSGPRRSNGVALARTRDTALVSGAADAAPSAPPDMRPATAAAELGYGAWTIVPMRDAPSGATFGAALSTLPSAAVPSAAPDRSRMVRDILARSRAGYAGSCPCPDSRDRAGRRCGARSAYLRAGGEAPLCYASDVTEAMIAGSR